DSMGCCYFIGVNFETIDLLTKAVNAMYGTKLSSDDLANIGKDILRMEILFNEKAGLTREMNKLPEFFREQSSNPLELKITYSEEELKNFWNRLI
ncbi:MAG: aldehyde ferredoxin oxidoreductase C-terminal domain-containing protein, partial [Promethearchaeota archaeon]